MTKRFQIITTAIFIVFAILGVALFALYKGGGKTQTINISIWGTYSDNIFNSISKQLGDNEEIPFVIEYTQFSEENFGSELVEALASGEGPDAIILSQDNILKHKNKIFPIPYTSFSERKFKDDYLEVAEVLLRKDDFYALPFSVDPMVMYWNRDILSNVGEVRPPLYWDELFGMIEKTTKIGNTGNIEKSTIALGEYDNVNHAKEIMSMLMLQAGTPIVETYPELQSMLSSSYSTAISPAEAALRFYTEFSNPSKSVYSWNRGMNESKNKFLAGDLALYFGFSSELKELRKSNPNLNFDVAKIPQSKDTERESSFAKMNTIAVVKNSPNMNSAFRVAFVMSGVDAVGLFSDMSGTPPISKALINERQEDAFQDIFYKSAIISNTWLDPNPEESSLIFKDMIENVTSGKLKISESIKRANTELQGLINKLK